MQYLYPKYFDIEDWIILDTYVCHAFDDDETPVTALKVKIGTLNPVYDSTKNTYDIIRWISQKEYDYLIKNKGVIIW